MMKTILCIGEALIDFIPAQKGCALKDNAVFERACGGAPANVAAAAALLGAPAKMITQLGNDAFGDYITEVLKGAGVDTSCILRTDKANTALAFVALQEDGNRDFMFYRNPSADMLLESSQIKDDWFSDCGILHFCSVDLIDAPVKDAHRRAIALAKANGANISFDPNIRLPLWDDEQECKKTVQEFIDFADILKISDEELEFITGETDIEKAVPGLFARGVKMIMFTRGKQGASIITPDFTVFADSVSVTVQDTTGAGDSIIGAFLFCLTEKGVTDLSAVSKEDMEAMLRFANFYSSYSVTKKGAITSYAGYDEIIKFIKKQIN
jgi:fructokinase